MNKCSIMLNYVQLVDKIAHIYDGVAFWQHKF